MGKKAKDHRKRVQARNNGIEQDKNKIKKMQQKFLEEFIKQEKENGLFDNNQMINNTNKATDINTIEQILDGPTL